MLIGSTYFFKDIEGFTSKDIDFLELVDNPTEFKTSYQLSGKGKCVFKWRRMSPSDFINISLHRKCPMELGKFLVKEFVNEIGFTISDLKKLKPLRDSLDDKHKYEAIIYDAYIENGFFSLSEEQLMLAFETYKKYRK